MLDLSATRTLTSTILVKCATEDAVRALHDPPTLIRLNPVVIDYTVDSSDPTLWHITDCLTVLGFKTNVKYSAKFEPSDDGVTTHVNAGLGTKTMGRWTVRSVDGGTELVEHVTLRAQFFLMPFILKTLDKSHHQLHKDLANLLENPDSRNVKRNSAMPAPEVNTIYTFLSTLLVSLFPLLVTQFVRFVYPEFTHWSALALTAGAVSILARLVVVRSKDPYGSFHLSLNRPLGESSGMPATEWLNMGYWAETTSFPEACQALALKLAHAAKMEDGGNVLDVGHGSGDSLILLASHPSVPHPSSITGITSLSAHHERSQERLTQLGGKTQVKLFCGDAVAGPSSHGHPLDPSSDANFDTIFALDCAYHFRTRQAFLQQSFDRLAPGGCIALADICFSATALSNPRLRTAMVLLRMMPKENVVSAERYVECLQEIGYVDVTLEDISPEVFPGFAEFLKTKGLGWALFGGFVSWFAANGARFVIVVGRKE